TELGMIGEFASAELDIDTLVENLKNNESVDSDSILSLLEVFERMSVQFNEINRLVKLRKGFEGKSQQLKEFEQLFHSLGFYLNSPRRTMIWESEHPIDTRKILGN